MAGQLQFVIGKNAKNNTHLVQTASNMDVWFHIDGAPSAHLILRNPDETDLKTLRKQGIIYRMALTLKQRSKYRKSNNIPVIYDYCKNVIPQDKPGRVVVKSPKIINT